MRAIYLPAYSFPSYGVVSEIAPGMAGSRMGPSEGVKHVINCIKRPQADSRYQTRTASRVGHTDLILNIGNIGWEIVDEILPSVPVPVAPSPRYGVRGAASGANIH